MLRRDNQWNWYVAIAAVPKEVANEPLKACKAVDEGDQCGEDSYCVLETDRMAILSVADGVGGWRRRAIDPSAFSRSLMEQVGQAASEQPGFTGAMQLIQQAFRGLLDAFVRGEEEPFGSSTISVAALDRSTGWLDLANLGDSGAMLFREGRIFQVMHRKQNGWNRPAQLTLEPSGSPKGNPAEADHKHLQVQEGDTLIMATDGLWDNLFVDQIVERVHRAGDDEEALALDLAESARATSLWPYEENVTPFAVESEKAGHKHAGGKKDDITVLVALIYR